MPVCLTTEEGSDACAGPLSATSSPPTPCTPERLAMQADAAPDDRLASAVSTPDHRSVADAGAGCELRAT